MGLSAFEESSSPPPYCSPSIDRSLTTSLIEVSNSPSKSSSFRFSHTPEWADGLDTWSSPQIPTKNEISRRHLDFHCDLGLYLPRHEKPNSAPISLKGLQIHSKIPTNNFTPERIRQLLRKEKDLLLQNDLSDQQLTLQTSPTVPNNTCRQATSTESSSTTEVRLPLRHLTNSSSQIQPPPPQQPISPTLNQDTLKSLLKEHLTSLLTRGASTINANRTLINIPSVDIRQQIRTDTKLMEERYSKLEELITTPPSSSSSSQQIKSNSPHHIPPFMFQQRSTLGLTVTPVDLTSQRNFPSVSLEKMAQQRNFTQDIDSSSSIVSSRPSTQPVPLPTQLFPTYQYQQQQRVVLKRNLETTNSSSGENLLSHEYSNKMSEQQIRKGHHPHNRLSPKTGIHRVTAPTTTIELLPPIISGKRLHIPIANHRYL